MILGVDWGVNGKILVEQRGHFFEVVGADGPQHSVSFAVRKDSCVWTVPSDGVIEVGDGVHEERSGSISGVFGEPLVEGEGKPLGKTVLC